jgi:hypothetical protein
MSLDAAISLGLLAAGVAFGGYHYREVHLPDFAMVKAEALYEKCVRDCHTVCTENGIPIFATPEDPRECKCEHCLKYIEGDV